MGLDVYAEDWDPAKALTDDVQGQALRAATEALRQGQGTLKRKLDRGVTPDEFKRGQALLEGYEAAVRGLERAWAKARQP